MAGTGLDGVTVVRDGATALRDVTLSAEDGELLAVLGPSGCGKSTLLRVIAGLTPVRTGEVYIGGRRVTAVPTQQRGVAMVFESTTLVPFLDVAHNLGWGLRARHTPEAEVSERVAGRARQLRLSGLLSRMPNALSAGERGVVGVGRALVRAPDVFLLDEPLAHLDATQRLSVRRQIVEVVRSLGVTTFYVTHDPVEALAVADRVALMNDGVLVQVGTPREVYREPADLFVAGFVGFPPPGLLAARLVVDAGAAGFQVGARTLPLWAPVPPELRDRIGGEVVLALRAQDVGDASRPYDPALVTLAGTVIRSEFTGPHRVVAIAVDGPAVTAPGAEFSVGGGPGSLLRALLPPRTDVRLGDSVRVAVDATRAHVFDPATGRALWHPPEDD